MKILQINCWFDSGSTGKIVYALHQYLKKQGDDSYVIYGMGQKSDDPHAFRTTSNLVRKAQSFCSRITGYPYGGCCYGTAVALKHIKDINPDVVHIQCRNGYMVNIYRILAYLKVHKIPTVITNHAEFMYTGGCTHAVECNKWKTGCHDCNKISKEHPVSYFFDRTEKEWKLMYQACKGFDDLYVCNVSKWLNDRACQSPFYEGHKVITVHNGLDTNVFHYTPDENVKESAQAEGKPIVIHVTPGFYSSIKGGSHVIEMANRMKDVTFLVVGSEKDTSIPMPSNLHFAGRVDDQINLAKYYSISDVCLLTSIRETFSMVTAESLCCGTPVVGFKAGGPETIAIPEYSSFVDQGDDDELEKKLREMLKKKVDKKELSHLACPKYSDQTMCETYRGIYQEMLQSKTLRSS